MGLVLRQLWRRPIAERRYYLGEWHLHPAGAARPSATDDRQMRSFANASDHHCPEPVLVIVGGAPETGWNVGCWVYPRGRKIPLREVEPWRRRCREPI